MSTRRNLNTVGTARKSWDTSDNLPLRVSRVAKNNHGHCTSYDSLSQYSRETCEFCDTVLNNKYEAIKHNAKHIIIPLLKLKLYQCESCFYCFTSWTYFNTHLQTEHPINKSNTKMINKLVFEDDIEDSDTEEQDFSYSHNLNEIVLNELTNSCAVKLECIVVSDSDSSNDEIVNKQVKECGSDYDSLNLVGKYICKFCHQNFSTRYQLIQHNVVHMKIKPPRMRLCPLCEGFFENKKALREHMKQNHKPNFKKSSLHTCKECNLPYYSWIWHNRRYHAIYQCGICKTARFKRKDLLLKHCKDHDLMTECTECNIQMTAYELEKHIQSSHAVTKVCDICFMLVKDRKDLTYKKVGEYSVDGARSACERCGSLYFELNVVHRSRRVELKERIQCQWLKLGYRRRSKLVSNEVRLKNIRENVRASHDGLLGGGCLPYAASAHARQPWLHDYLYQWKATGSGRNRAMPHIKSYVRLSPDRARAAFFLLTSGNVSKAAWGVPNKGNGALRVMNYEAGVLLLPSFVINSDFFSIDRSEKDHLSIPYDLPPTKYTSEMSPWVSDYLM